MSKIDILKENGTFNAEGGSVKADNFLHGIFFDPNDLMQVKYEMLRSVDKKELSIKSDNVMIKSLILFFLLLHVVRSCRDQKTGTLLRLGVRLTHLFLILQIFSACCVGFAALRGSWANLLTANTDPNVALWPTQALFLLEYVLQLFVCVLSLRVGEKAIALLFALSREKDGVDEAEALTRAASGALLWTAGSHLALQIVKILCVRILLTVDLTVELPLLPLVLILACLLLSRLLADRRRLRRENESFI